MKVSVSCVVVSLFYGLSSCQTDEKPPGVLGKEKFAEILTEMYTGEARLTGVSITPDSAIKLFRPFEESLLRKNGISDSLIKITYQYYTAHPLELEAVYDIAIDTLSLREQRAGVNPK